MHLTLLDNGKQGGLGMRYSLSNRSILEMKGVDKRLFEIVKAAINITELDFAVIDGVRTKAEQRALVEAGASWTMNSKHLTGRAIDFVPLVANKMCWNIESCAIVAEAMRTAAREQGVRIRWGGAWHIQDITQFGHSLMTASDEYVAMKGKKDLDGPHIELS